MTAVLEKDPVKPDPSPFGRVSLRRKVVDKAAFGVVTVAVIVAMVPLVWVLYTLIDKGIDKVLDPDWWQKSESKKGMYNAIIGTLEQTAIAAAISVPLGIFVAVYLVEYGNRNLLSRLTTFMVDILSGVPSIVAALFIYAVWRTTFDLQRSGFVVALALVLLMTPIVVRSTEEMLKIVPQDLREASYALGVPKWKTILRIVLPTALSGIVTGVMLAIARVMGESAPVLILVGYTRFNNANPFDGNQSSLPLSMVQNYNKGVSSFGNAWGAALTLVIIIAVINIAARLVSAVFSPKKA